MNRCTHACEEGHFCTCLFQRDGGHRVDGAKSARIDRAAVGIWLAIVWAVCTALAKYFGAPIEFL